MYKPSDNMPLNSFQVVSPCENQTDFRAGQVIRFIIPRSIGFWDPHTSRLQLEVQTANNNFKMCFAHDCGVASLIDMVRISQNGIVLSETTEYATLNNLFTLYSDSLSVKQRNSTQNGARDYVVGAAQPDLNVPALLNRTSTSGAVLGECLNSDGGLLMDKSPKKYQLELRGIGLFELMNVVPSIALGDLLIEIRLVNQNRQALKVHPATAVNFAVTPILAGVTTTLLTPAFVGFNNLADSPLLVGMKFKFTTVAGLASTDAEKTITALSQDDDSGVITATFTPIVGNAGANDIGKTNFKITSGNDQAANLVQTTAFVVNRSSLLLQVIRPPQQYIEEIAAKVQEGMMIDLNTYTTYRASVQSGIKNVTIDIPAMMSRARAVFSVPRLQDNNEFGTGYLPTNAGAADGSDVGTNNVSNNILGQYATLLRYRTQIGELYYPNQPVGLQQFVKVKQTHFSAQHIVELEKALNAAQIPLRSLNSTKQNFVIPRVLAKYGSSMNLDKGIRLYLEYLGNSATLSDGTTAVSLDVVTFVNHINRVMVTANGLEVLS